MSHAALRTEEELEELLGLEIEFKLESSTEWISTPSTMTLMSQVLQLETKVPYVHFCPLLTTSDHF